MKLAVRNKEVISYLLDDYLGLRQVTQFNNDVWKTRTDRGGSTYVDNMRA